jgi:hypothetical protein
MLELIGKENIYPETKTIGEAGNSALRAANKWLKKFSAEDVISQEKEGS